MADLNPIFTGTVEHFVRQSEPAVHTLGRRDGSAAEVLVAHKDFAVHDIKPFLDRYLTAPERRAGTATLLTLESFIEHVNRFKDHASVVFANASLSEPALVSVLDYHEPTPGLPRFGVHRGLYEFPLSDEWKIWTGADGEEVTQAEFAAFLEDHVEDVAEPVSAGGSSASFAKRLGVEFASPARLLELSRGLTVKVGATVRAAQNLQSGEAQIQFTTTHSDESGAPLRIPGAFLLAIPVFRSGPLYEIAARLRYRVLSDEGRVLFRFQLFRHDKVFDHAFTEAVDRVLKNTSLPVLYGSPEEKS
jgi:uncharacterized protein YfdQ (DUF2303 family)